MIVALSLEPFALWQAQWQAPERTARPLVAIEEGRVRHRNRSAGRRGIEVGMSLAGARAQAPEVAVLEAASPTLESAWRSWLTTFWRLTPRLESARVGLAFLELSELEARQLATNYGARVGAGSSLEQARLRALAAHPGKPRLRGPLSALPSYLLRGLGLAPASVQRLRWLGVERLGQLLEWTPAQLEAFLGPEAPPLIRHLFGPFRQRVGLFTPPEVLSAHHDFEEAATEPYQIGPTLERLCRRLEQQLGDRAGRRLTVRASAQGLAFNASRLGKHTLRRSEPLQRLAGLALADTGAQPLGLDRLTLELTELTRPNDQGALWRRRERLEAAVRVVEARFPGATLRLEARDPHALAHEHAFALVRTADGEEVAGAIAATADRARQRRRPAHAL